MQLPMTTTEKLLEVVFSVESAPRLYMMSTPGRPSSGQLSSSRQEEMVF
jgi:hypothetical protein